MARWILSLWAFSLLSAVASADEITVFDVRSNLPLSADETVYRDFYLNAGSESGLKPGMVITVTRRMTLYDSYRNKSAGDLKVSVGRLKVIHVQKGLSVARQHSIHSRVKQPLLVDDFIMVGDQVDLRSATMGSSRPRKNSKASPPPPPPAPATPQTAPATASADFASESPAPPQQESIPVPVVQ